MTIAAMKLALEALEEYQAKGAPFMRCDAAANALRAAIEEAEKQEPVAWMVYTLDGKSVCVTDNPADFTDQHKALPLYTAPRQWQGLTDEEIERAWTSMNHDPAAFVHFAGGALWAEAKCKEKNNG